MVCVAIKVGTSLEKEMGQMFGPTFHGCSHASLHFAEKFAVYEVSGKPRHPLFGVSPLEEGRQDVDAHIQRLSNALGVYNKTIETVRFLVADNSSNNKVIAFKLAIPLIECASHRFNLAVKKLYGEYEPIRSNVSSLTI